MTRVHPNSDAKLSSWKDAQRREKTILDRLNADPALALAACANPLFALEELGYELSDDLKQEFEDRLRFGPAYEQVRTLRSKIFDLAGKVFRLNSAESLHEVLSHLLEKKVARTLTAADTGLYYAFGFANDKSSDTLERLRDAHSIMKPLLQYRRLEASVPPFATRKAYDEIRTGKLTLPVSSITVRLGKTHK